MDAFLVGLGIIILFICAVFMLEKEYKNMFLTFIVFVFCCLGIWCLHQQTPIERSEVIKTDNINGIKCSEVVKYIRTWKERKYCIFNFDRKRMIEIMK